MKTRNQNRFRYATDSRAHALGRRINRLSMDAMRLERNVQLSDAELEWLASALDAEGMIDPNMNRADTIEAIEAMRDELVAEYNASLRERAERSRTCGTTNFGDVLKAAGGAS